ncbi:MAG TPA: hypothetical protein VFN20_07515, partial [Candidatus Acidoferrum sp.]|nr:hypothetical protein [Candidatus Acidoferrum sp.]
MMRKVFMIAVVCGLALIPARGQEKKAGKSYVLKAARLFDGKSDSLAMPGLVVVQDGKIAGVGASARVPDGAEVI